MTTFFYASMVLGIGVVYAALALAATAHGASGWWFVAGIPAIYVIVASVLVLLWFTMSRLWSDPPTEQQRLGRGATARMLAFEIMTVVTSWPSIILHRLLVRDPRVPAKGVPIVLVHGVWNNDGVWVAFRRRLARRDIRPVYTINCGPPLADIERFAEQLSSKIDGICARTGATRVVLIGHSMGGLIGRTYLRRFGGGRVALLITIGTPHHGSMLATVALGRCVEQMRPGNSWLGELNANGSGPQTPPTVSIWSRHDTMVAPQSSSRLAAARNVVVSGIAHNALIRHADVFGHVVAELESRGLLDKGTPNAPRDATAGPTSGSPA